MHPHQRKVEIIRQLSTLALRNGNCEASDLLTELADLIDTRPAAGITTPTPPPGYTTRDLVGTGRCLACDRTRLLWVGPTGVELCSLCIEKAIAEGQRGGGAHA